MSECGGSKQQQSLWLWEPLAPSRRRWKTTPTKSLTTSTYMNSRKKLSFLQPTFSGRSSPSSRNPLCPPNSIVWTRMLKEKITCNYTNISSIINNNNNNNNKGFCKRTLPCSSAGVETMWKTEVKPELCIASVELYVEYHVQIHCKRSTAKTSNIHWI